MIWVAGWRPLKASAPCKWWFHANSICTWGSLGMKSPSSWCWSDWHPGTWQRSVSPCTNTQPSWIPFIFPSCLITLNLLYSTSCWISPIEKALNLGVLVFAQKIISPHTGLPSTAHWNRRSKAKDLSTFPGSNLSLPSLWLSTRTVRGNAWGKWCHSGTH